MNLLGSLVVFLGGILLLSLLPAVIRLLSRGRGGIVVNLVIPMLVIVLIVAGGSFYLDHNGDIVPGTLETKHEDIITYDTGEYQRYLYIDVSFQPRGASLPTTVRLEVDATLFDQLHNGEAVQVRYINPAGLFLYSRLVQQTTLTAIYAILSWPFLWPVVFAISLMGIMVLAFGRRRRRPQSDVIEPPLEPGSEPVPPPSLRRPIALVLFIIWLGAFFFAIFQQVLIPVSTDSWQTATAQIKTSRHYTEVTQSLRSSRNIPLVQDFDIDEFTFTPQGSNEPVVGVDVIDSPATGLPEEGSRLTIKYSPDNPRTVQIPGATYTHYWKNPLGALAMLLAILLALGFIWFMVRLGWKILTQGLVAAVARR